MRLGIMQPYFFPYLGYFSLIKHTDRWILFDTVQYIRHGWINRNRILKQNDGWLYIKVPLQKHERDTLIKDIQASENEDWRQKILSQIVIYKKKAPHYWPVRKLLESCFEFSETNSITHLNQHYLQQVCNYLDIPFDCQIFSEMDLDIGAVDAPDEWALRISQALGADEYWNPEGGDDFFDRDKYAAGGVKLQFLKSGLPEYDQQRPNFENGLSMIDVLMWNDQEQVHRFLDDFQLFE
jgi:hypothetical protein